MFRKWFTFAEPANGATCFLAFNREGKPIVRHPNCKGMADVIAELDAFYCMECHSTGRISGKWVVEMVEANRG